MTQINDDDDAPGEDLTPPPRADEPDDDLPPTPRTTVLTLALCVLNVAAVLGFAYLVLMDFGARQRWTLAVLRHDLAILGLPLKEEANPARDAAIGAQDAYPAMTLEPEWLQQAYKDRGGKSVQDKFRAAELVTQPVRAEQLTDKLLKEHFAKGEGNPVATQDAEIERLKQALPQKIDSAVEEAAKKAKNAVQKQNLLYTDLLPLAQLTDKTDQVVELDKAIRAVKDAKQLDELVVEAAKRKLIVDLLARLEEFRPHALKVEENIMLRVAALQPAKGQAVALSKDRYKVKTDDLMEMLTKRVDETLAPTDVHGTKRYDIEKRRCVAFLLFNLSRLPNAKTPLYPAGRAEVVCGVREFAQAAETTALVCERLEKRALDAVDRDRGGITYDPQGFRIHRPEKFAKQLTHLLSELGTFPKKGEKADPQAVKRRTDFETAATVAFTQDKGKFQTDQNKTAGQKVLEAVKSLMAKQNVRIMEDKNDAGKFKVRESMFDAAVVRMVDGYEPGFVGRHHDTINVLRELSARIKEMDNRLNELETEAKSLEAEYKVRQAHSEMIQQKVVEARAKTRSMADELARLQNERFRAQVELADADRRNQLMERRIRELELARIRKGRRPLP